MTILSILFYDFIDRKRITVKSLHDLYVIIVSIRRRRFYMIKKLIEVSNSKGLDTFIGYASYLGLSGLLIYVSLRVLDVKNKEQFVFEHSRNASLIF